MAQPTTALYSTYASSKQNCVISYKGIYYAAMLLPITSATLPTSSSSIPGLDLNHPLSGWCNPWRRPLGANESARQGTPNATHFNVLRARNRPVPQPAALFEERTQCSCSIRKQCCFADDLAFQDKSEKKRHHGAKSRATFLTGSKGRYPIIRLFYFFFSGSAAYCRS